MLEKLFKTSIALIAAGGYPAVVGLSLLGSALIPIPNELVILFSGFQAFQGHFTLAQVIFWGTLGNVLGCVVCYWLGLKGGRPLVEKYGRYILLTKKKLTSVEKFYDRWGEQAVLIGRLLPIVRAVSSFPAGISRMRLGVFILYSIIGSFVWVVTLAVMGYIFGPAYGTVLLIFRKFDYLIIALGLIFLGIYIWWARK